MRARLGDRVALLWALPVLVLVAVKGWQLRWVADDAFINFRVVDHLIAGNGPVFNVGERIEVGTSTVWLAILWIGSGIGGIQIEWLSVVLGLALTVLGVGAACLGASVLARERDPGGRALLLPLGALVFAVVPAGWQFYTSGLETGLSIGWLGVSFLCLVRMYRRFEPGAEPPGAARVALAAVLLGIGPLVRPDFAVFSVAFVAVLMVLAGNPLSLRGLRLAATAAALPILYEIFRAGYYATLVPNTAIAKEAAATYLSQGVRYLWDLVGTYWLWLPLIALLGWGAAQWLADRRSGHGRRALVALAPVAGGIVHALFVVKVGGDFMHGRLLLPGLFGILCPFAVVAIPLRRDSLALAAGVCVWAAVCGFALRVPYEPGVLEKDQIIVDERAYYVAQAGGVENPITVEDYSRFDWQQQGFAVRKRAEAGERVITFQGPNQDLLAIPPDVPAKPGLPVTTVAAANNVGLFGYAAGTDVWVVDRLGLGDPVAARVDLPERTRPGHEKVLPVQWVIGRFGDPERLPEPAKSDPLVGAARQSLDCSVWWWDGQGTHRESLLRDTLEAVSEPLTPGRFISNLALAPKTAGFRVPRDPQFAQPELCGPQA